MRRRSSHRMLLAAVTTLLVAAPATPAHADDDWVSPPCATGEITASSGAVTPDGDLVIQVDGWSARCGVAATTGGQQFGLIIYTSAGAWIGQLTDYLDAGPTPVSYLVNYTVSTATLGGLPHALCLAYAEERRMSCVHVSSAGPNQPPNTFHLDHKNSSLVTRRCDGYCGNCVGEPGVG
ncbi:hypothetical protein [Micromonospora sp. CPCC 206061]|uniref:hypothetical protein n=1 Tax=Micromonospora sp. CPCC 206061 TaxID=3122410 RepID=UPI002FF38267